MEQSIKDKDRLAQQMSVKEQRIEELTRELQDQTEQANRMSGEIEGMLN